MTKLFSTSISICITLALSTLAVAQPRRTTSPSGSSASPSYSYSSAPARNLIISPALGFFAPGSNSVIGNANGNQASTGGYFLSGLFGIGADVETMLSSDVSVGGFFRYYNTSDSLITTEYKQSLVTIGGLVRGYVDLNSWLLHFGTGFDILMPSLKVGSTDYSIDTGFGFMLSAGFFYKFSPSFMMGVESMRLLGLGEKLNGWLTEDYMLKARFAL